MVKKGQAAMEFLMTYGWAILVVLIAIGALAYFGVLSPQRFLPSSCTLSPGFACGEFKIIDDTGALDTGAPASADVLVQVTNGVGKGITTVTFALAPTVGSCAADAGNPTTIADGDTAGFYWDCDTTAVPAGSEGSRFKGALTFTYTASGETLSHTITGDITTRIE